MANSWVQLAKTTLQSSASNIRVPASGNFDAYKRLYVEFHVMPEDSNSIRANLTFNGDEGDVNNYAMRRLTDGGSAAGYDNLDFIEDIFNGDSFEFFATMEVWNIDGKPKITFSRSCGSGGIGLNDTSQAYLIGNWSGTVQIRNMNINAAGSGSFAQNSTMTVFGSDVSYPNLSNGTIFEESDTGTHYMWDGTDTWNEVT